MRFISKPLAAALLCVMLAACGGSSDTTAVFKAGYLRLRGPLHKTAVAIGQAVAVSGHETNLQLANEFTGLATRFRAQIASLAKLKPPASLASAFAGTIGAADRIDADLSAISAAATANSRSRAGAAARALVADARTLNASDLIIKQKLRIKAI